MRLNTGTKLGTYEILGPLGAGGMGVVYRARDTRLKRDVAIKSLTAAFAPDAERLARFQREAESLAALNHPNIGAIYGFEESEGARYLILEFVDGETLEERLKRGALPLEEALRVAVEIANALEAAHEKGVVHRDLKPSNIKITPEGHAKVLDFGLALPVAAAESKPPSLSNSPTMNVEGTREGVILGTAAYMSPEQAKGRKVDRRTDIFSFGCVLYEMLTGRRAFEGDNVTEILARILERDPDWTLLPSNAPPAIQKLLQLCLEKNLEKRRRDAGDVRMDIEQSLKEPTSGTAAMPRVTRANVRLLRLGLGAAIFLAAILAIPAAIHLRETPLPTAPEMRLQINTPSSSATDYFALSPDGRYVVFVASAEGRQQLWLRPLDAVNAQPLAGTEGADQPFWSPDSKSIGFFATGKLQRTDVGGGPPQAIASSMKGAVKTKPSPADRPPDHCRDSQPRLRRDDSFVSAPTSPRSFVIASCGRQKLKSD